MNTENARQIAEWNGAAGESWRTNAERFDRMLRPFINALLIASDIKPGEKVLEIGCGAGALAIEIADRMAQVTAVDVSENLLSLARRRQKEAGASIEFLIGDASLMQFEPNYDLLISHLGVMFFDEPVAAFANMRKALKPNGRLACLTWRGTSENEAASMPELASAPDIIAPARSPEAPGPFSFADSARVKRILMQAGFKEINIAPFDAILRFGEGDDKDGALEDAIVMAYQIGPLRRLLINCAPSVKAAVHHRLRELFATRLQQNCVELAGAAWVITALA
jgi:SAM-dependent methyltransferase